MYNISVPPVPPPQKKRKTAIMRWWFSSAEIRRLSNSRRLLIDGLSGTLSVWTGQNGGLFLPVGKAPLLVTIIYLVC
jgi:hypothetical protein